MKILFISQATLKKELGGPKVLIELGEAIEKLGHETTLVGPEEVSSYLVAKFNSKSNSYAENISRYLKEVINEFDVIDVDANYLYKIENPSKIKQLIVARSVLFGPHFLHIKFPSKKKITTKLKELLQASFGRKDSHERRCKKFYQSLDVADVINVSNDQDSDQLLSDGYSKSKILSLPYGLSEKKNSALQEISQINKTKNNIVFLGTFDYRKGCLDIPKIFSEIRAFIPDSTLTLLGTKGLFSNTKVIYAFFPKNLRPFVKIVPTFKSSDLPLLLKEFKIAIFPSYIEGFPFSVLENSAAGIPVIAYNSPGTSTILNDEYLVDRGDWNALAKKVIYYLKNEESRVLASRKVVIESQKYNWTAIAKATMKAYSEYYKEKNRIVNH